MGDTEPRRRANARLLPALVKKRDVASRDDFHFSKQAYKNMNQNSTYEVLQSVDHDVEKIVGRARSNLDRWQSRGIATKSKELLSNLKKGPGKPDTTFHGQRFLLGVVDADWGVVAGHLTRRFGEQFVVLNMANATFPGGGEGGLVDGGTSQEADMFRRSTCLFQMRPVIDLTAESLPAAVAADSKQKHLALLTKVVRYTDAMQEIVKAEPSSEAVRGGVRGERNCFVNAEAVCFLGPRRDGFPDGVSFAYEKMPEAAWFPFYELRCAAIDISKDKSSKTETSGSGGGDGGGGGEGSGVPATVFDEMRKRIRAQFMTCQRKAIRPFFVLGAFGCGLFGHNPETISAFYREVMCEPDVSKYLQGGVVVFATYEPPSVKGSGGGLTKAFRKGLLKFDEGGGDAAMRQLTLTPFLLPVPSKEDVGWAGPVRWQTNESALRLYDAVQLGGWVGLNASNGANYFVLEDLFGLDVGEMRGGGGVGQAFDAREFSRLRGQMELLADPATGACMFMNGYGGYLGGGGRFGLPSYEKLQDMLAAYEYRKVEAEYSAMVHANAGWRGMDEFSFSSGDSGFSSWQHVYDEYWRRAVEEKGGR